MYSCKGKLNVENSCAANFEERVIHFCPGIFHELKVQKTGFDLENKTL